MKALEGRETCWMVGGRLATESVEDSEVYPWVSEALTETV